MTKRTKWSDGGVECNLCPNDAVSVGLCQVCQNLPEPRSAESRLRAFMGRAIEYLNLAMLESFGGVRFSGKERLDAASEALRLLHEGLGHPPNCKKCRDTKVVELGAGYLGNCPECVPQNED